MIMDRLKYRREIEVLFSAGFSADEIRRQLQDRYGSSAPCRATIYNWIREVKRGDRELLDRSKSGRPPSIVTDPNIDKVQEVIASQPGISCLVISERLKIGKRSVWTILKDHLCMDKMNSRWVPKHLSDSQREARVDSCKEVLRQWISKWDELVDRIVTGDETWCLLENPHNRITASQGF